MENIKSNLIAEFLNIFDNEDDPILITRREIVEFLEDFIAKYEKVKHQPKKKIIIPQ